MTDILKVAEKFNRYMATRQQLEVQDLYARFAPRYPGVFRIEEGDREHGEDFRILHGYSAAGRFEIFDNGLDIVFDAYKPDGSYTHWHPVDAEELIDDIQEFMQGNCRY